MKAICFELQKIFHFLKFIIRIDGYFLYFKFTTVSFYINVRQRLIQMFYMQCARINYIYCGD